jgi:serine protein kinase
VAEFKNNKNNEAFLDRIYVIKVPYCLRVTEERKIYEKLVSAASCRDAPCAPETLRCSPASRSLAAARARELEPLLEAARL